MSPEVQTDQKRIEEASQDDPRLVGPDSKPIASSSSRRRVNPLVFVVIVVVLLVVGVSWYIYAQGFEETDDAEVDGHLNPIAARIDGTVKAVHVDDNQSVEAGKLMVELDPRDYQVALDQSEPPHHPHHQSIRSLLTAGSGHECGRRPCCGSPRSRYLRGKAQGITGHQRTQPG
jgi:hypothetical protein